MVDTENNILTVKEAALALGLSEACIRSWIYTRRIDYLKVGRAVRIEARTIRDFIQRNRVKAIPRASGI